MDPLAGWIRRSWRAMLADLELVDCGSLEVLLICTDDLALADAAPLRVIDRVVDVEGRNDRPGAIT